MAKATLRPADEASAASSAASSTTTAAVEKNDGIHRVKDEDGRIIGIRTLSVVEEMRLLKVLGEFNGTYYNFCAQVCRICEIGGQPVPLPNNEREIEAVAARLGKAGVAAMMAAIVEAAGGTDGNEDREREQVKK